MRRILCCGVLFLLVLWGGRIWAEGSWNQVRSEVARENAQKAFGKAKSYFSEGELKKARLEYLSVLRNLEEIKACLMTQPQDEQLEQEARRNLEEVNRQYSASLFAQVKEAFKNGEKRLKASELNPASGYYQKGLDSLAELEKIRSLTYEEGAWKEKLSRRLNGIKQRSAPAQSTTSAVTTSLPAPEQVSPPPAATAAPASPEESEAPQEAEVIIDSHPSGAALFIDEELELSTPSRLTLPTGAYRIRLEKSGFLPIKRAIEVKAGKVNLFTCNFSKEYVEVAISTVPTQAQVLIDGQIKGYSDCRIKAAVGEHRLTLRKEGWADREENLTLVSNTPQVISRDLVRGGEWTQLTLESDPAGAEVNLDGKTAGVTPLNLETTLGSHALRFSLPGYKSEVRKVEAVSGTPNRVMVFMTQGRDEEETSSLAGASPLPGASPLAAPSPQGANEPAEPAAPRAAFPWAALGLFCLAGLILALLLILGFKSRD